MYKTHYFSAQTLVGRIIHENYIIHFFSGHLLHHIRDRMTKRKLYPQFKLMEKYPMEYMFIILFFLI